MDRGDALSRATESLALAVRIRCQHNIVRSASETQHRREDASSTYSHRMPPVSSLRSELPSARTPSPHGTHRKMVAFSIDRIDINRQCLYLLRQCRASVAQSPAYQASDSSFMHSLGVCGEVASDHRRSFLYPSRLYQHRGGGPCVLTGVSHR
jgi:hypothetical protein